MGGVGIWKMSLKIAITPPDVPAVVLGSVEKKG